MDIRKGEKAGTASEQDTWREPFRAPTISMPKGGGAIRGMGEKFSANPVTGTGSMSVPIATSPGRSGFGPQLSVTYDSGAGNGPFGFGWNLSLPAIARKTDKGLPKYRDAEDSDTFILSGAEDLVPAFREKDLPDPADKWVRNTNGIPIIHEDTRVAGGNAYRVRRFRPRIEGLFALIERWSNQTNPADVFWRSITRDNITTWYGKTDESRIFDPVDPSRIFSWLICQSHDDKGNVIVYGYQPEDGENVDLSRAHERNRGARADRLRSANRYLKRICYGNRDPYLPALTETDPWPEPPATGDVPSPHNLRWMFEVVFDYDQGHVTAQPPNADGMEMVAAAVTPAKIWAVRDDAFSMYRAGFEVRTYRLCRRVLMFHHFPGETDVDVNCLVRSTDFTHSDEVEPDNERNAVFSFLRSVSQTGYKRQGASYLKRSLPPMEFEYTEALIDPRVHEIAPASLENLPYGLDGAGYQWVDLESEGLSGILSEQADGWFYKRNLSPINLVKEQESLRAQATFAPIELIATKPAAALGGGRAQLMDLAGDGQLDLVMFDGPTPGFYEHDLDRGWEPFRAFLARLNRDTRDPNLRFVDLDGDGHADVLITEDEALAWHPSLGEEGFGAAERVAKARDEELGPALVFADGTQSIYLADMSGDGLSDLVRIRNGEVCYWPNLGYGEFGAKVTMDNAPWFDAPDQFDQRRIQLADVDGSGVTDIIYLHGDGVRIHFNESGNGWRAAHALSGFPEIHNAAAVTAVDLLGNGTACLVWSSPLPNDSGRSMRYIDLMGGQKPHLLVKTRNNLGAETQIEYAPSTKFYLQDKLAGRPWITRIPFPVHVVERSTITDQWRNTAFSSTYSYHHGYFDGVEREFRGFGRVEQTDVENFHKFAAANKDSPYITDDWTLYQPPVKTITWFHTGAAIDRERILTQFEHEYFPNSLAARPATIQLDNVFAEKALPEPELDSLDLTPEEWREALRACKGMTLRQEVYELAVDSLQPAAGKQSQEVAVRLFSAGDHNCDIRRLQPQGDNRHAVFLVTESEAASYHYELDLRAAQPLKPDPRVAHTLNLLIDDFGNVQQSVAVGYARWRQFDDPQLVEHIALIREVQLEQHVAYTETHHTFDAVDKAPAPAPIQYHRLRLPCEVRTYELTGFKPGQGRYFGLADFRGYKLSETLPQQGVSLVARKQYHELPQDMSATMRLVEHGRTLFFKDDLSDSLDLGVLGRLGIRYEQYKLALTDDLLDAIFTDAQLEEKVTPARSAHDVLNDWKSSGYLSGTDAIDKFGPDAAGQYWMRSGIVGFTSNPEQHFYLPEKYTDPFDNPTLLEYDKNKYHLFVRSSRDALGNTVTVERFDYRVLAPSEMRDINGNFSEVCFDVLGMVVASAVKGKGTEADDLVGFNDSLVNPSLATIRSHFDLPALTAAAARNLFQPMLLNASARFLYHFGEKISGGKVTWCDRPAGAGGIVREQHAASLTIADPPSPLQIAFECSDGMGTVLMKRSQAEPVQTGGPLRWIVSGKIVLNNKGKPVKQYEPYFSSKASCCAEGDVHERAGVTALMYYDAVGRLVRTELPDGTLSRVEFSPWFSRSFDQNDSVKESSWYRRRLTLAERAPNALAATADEEAMALAASPEEKRAARLAAAHANTPAEMHFDSLGRDVIAIAHNRVDDGAGAIRDERYATFTRLDAEGKPLWIRDSNGNLVMQYISPPKANRDVPRVARSFNPVGNPNNDIGNRTPAYDIAGNLLFQHSMDAGDRWMISDAAGKPMLAWDMNDRGVGTSAQKRMFNTEYDALHRPTNQWLTLNQDPAVLVEAFDYCDTSSPTGATNLADAQSRNLIGQPVNHWDPSGLATIERIDLCGKPAHVTRRLIEPDADGGTGILKWPNTKRKDLLEDDTFQQLTEYDALGRMAKLYNWHRDITFDAAGVGQATPGATNRVAVYEPNYNERGALISEWLHIRATKRTDGNGRVSFQKNGPRSRQAIKAITYNEKSQKLTLKLGNDTITTYTYDEKTFRLTGLETQRATAPIGMQGLSYVYDPVGNITFVNDVAQETVYASNAVVRPEHRYVYDALYRLIESTGREYPSDTSPPSSSEGAWRLSQFPTNDDPVNYKQFYEYDSVGNFVSLQHVANGATGWTRRYATQLDSNRLYRTWNGAADWDHAAPNQRIEYRHDAHGNMLNLNRTETPPPILDEEKWGLDIRWDWRDMIMEFDCIGGGLARYHYGRDKQRTRKYIKRIGSVVEDRIYLGGYELYRRSNAGGMIEEIESHHLFEGEQRVLMVDDVITSSKGTLNLRLDGLTVQAQTLFRYQYSNHLGSACLELDDGAEIISYEEYHPYGTSAYRAMKGNIEAPPKRYRYTGMERDEESGLNYQAARFYVSWVARWATTDPDGLADGPNVYGYVRANPITWTDRTGTAGANEWTADFAATIDWLNNPSGELIFALQDPSPPVIPASAPMNYDAARAQADKQAAAYRASAGMTDPDVNAGHTVAARHVPDAPLSAADYDKQEFMQLQSRQVSGQRATVVSQDGSTRINTPHRAQEKLINQNVQSVKDANKGALTPKGLLDAGKVVKQSTDNVPLDQRNVDFVRSGPKAVPDKTAALVKPFDPKNATPELLAKIEAENAVSAANVPSSSTSPTAKPASTADVKTGPAASANAGTSTVKAATGSLNNTLFGLGLVSNVFQYFEFKEFFKDIEEKGWGSFGGNLYGGSDKIVEGLNSLPPNTTVDVVYPGGAVRRVTTSVYGNFLPLD